MNTLLKGRRKSPQIKALQRERRDLEREKKQHGLERVHSEHRAEFVKDTDGIRQPASRQNAQNAKRKIEQIDARLLAIDRELKAQGA